MRRQRDRPRLGYSCRRIAPVQHRRLDATRRRQLELRRRHAAGQERQRGLPGVEGLVHRLEIRAEFWADDDANSGIFLRCQDRNKVGAANAYEVNIFDKRPDPSYGTGAIVNVAKVARPMPKAGNRWNTYEITARGDRMVVVLNGQQTADGHDGKHRSGPIALQSAAGTIRFRIVEIRRM